MTVTRITTGDKDYNTWGWGDDSVYHNPLTRGNTHLEKVYPLFQFDFNTYTWLISFDTRTGVIPLMTSCCDEMSNLNPLSVTLHSDASRDSKVIVTYEYQGATTRLSGELALNIDGLITSYFNLETATALQVQRLIQNMGYPGVNVTRLPLDENRHYSWLVTFDPTIVPIMDELLTPRISVLTNRVIPFYAQNHVTFTWDYKLPQHEIQIITTATGLSGNIDCVIVNSLGIANVQFDGLETSISMEEKFNRFNYIYGTVTVFVPSNLTAGLSPLNISTTLTNRYIIFNDYIGVLPIMTCSGLGVVVTRRQQGNMMKLSGSFAMGRIQPNDNYNYSNQVNISSLRESTKLLKDAIDSLFDGTDQVSRIERVERVERR